VGKSCGASRRPRSSAFAAKPRSERCSASPVTRNSLAALGSDAPSSTSVHPAQAAAAAVAPSAVSVAGGWAQRVLSVPLAGRLAARGRILSAGDSGGASAAAGGSPWLHSVVTILGGGGHRLLLQARGLLRALDYSDTVVLGDIQKRHGWRT
jgi:hypothetical protein